MIVSSPGWISLSVSLAPSPEEYQKAERRSVRIDTILFTLCWPLVQQRRTQVLKDSGWRLRLAEGVFEAGFDGRHQQNPSVYELSVRSYNTGREQLQLQWRHRRSIGLVK